LLAVLKHAMYISTGIFQSSGRKSFAEHSHPPLPRRSATQILLGVANNLGVHVLGDLADEAHSDADDLLCVEAGEVAQDLVGAVGVREGQKKGCGLSIPWAVQDVGPDQDELRNNAEQVQVRAVCEQKVPQLQDLRQRRCACAHGQDGCEGVNLGLHAMRHQVLEQLRVHDLEHAVHKRQSFVHALHRPAHIARTLLRDQPLEARKSLHLALGRVQERSAQDVHTLHVTNLLGVIRDRRARGAIRVPRQNRGIRGPAKLRQRRGRLPAVDAGLVGVVEAPCDGVEDACDAVLRDAAAEQGVALERAERVVQDLGVGGRRALSDEVEVDLGAQRRRIEQDQPDVDAQVGLGGGG
jgi:hypothetical protein